jgi:hypothetical protein
MNVSFLASVLASFLKCLAKGESSQMSSLGWIKSTATMSIIYIRVYHQYW